jgi:TetR/AcrR family transcriptional repressor of bet genes
MIEKENLDENGSAKVPGKRRASKEFRREQLINATIDTLARKGFAATTLADVAVAANLSRGIVNFHFESKEKLLFQTLQYIADSYALNWQQELKRVEGKSAASQLHSLVGSDLNEKVCSPRLVSAWLGFYTEAQTRPAFQDLCWARDEVYLNELRTRCEFLKQEGGYAFEPGKTADAIYAMQEGLWLRLMLGSKSLKRETALQVAFALLGTLFPRHFDISGKPRK